MGVSNKNGGNRATPLSDEKSQYEKAVEDIRNTPDLEQARMKMLKLMNKPKVCVTSITFNTSVNG